jgi:hypothetical protein
LHVAERFTNRNCGSTVVNFCVDALRAESLFKLFNSVIYLTVCGVKFVESHLVVFFSLFEIEFKLVGFTVTLDGHIFLPIVHTLSVPFFHKAGISLEFIQLNASLILEAILFSFFFIMIGF